MGHRTSDAVVDLWLREPTDTVALVHSGTELLDAVERERWRRFTHPDSARSYAAAHILARNEIGRLVARDPASLRFDRTCETCGAPHGRPRLLDRPALHLSLSRTPTLVALAVSRSGPVGVDVERRDATSFEGFDEVALHPEERTPARAAPEDGVTAWVRKEAALKALGVGLRVDPARIRTPAFGRAAEVVPGLAPVTVLDVEGGLEPVDHAVAVAVVGEGAPVVVRRH
ncbi:4'-phosphopantetheinyl transferase family protein [Terrabacter terrigena]|uniref:4'-phosphopantetheinyl transferase family protein n=1 Tax=Terrabacter terrigena TaxID=574718 RepID=A0ABW3MY79_9MICO